MEDGIMCGIIGIAARDREVSEDLYAGLVLLQHRGKESAGIVTQDSKRFYAVREMGTVDTIFGHGALDTLRGNTGIGHIRYSTAGGSSIENAQPIEGEFRGKQFWLAHNGNFVRYEHIREEMIRRGYVFRTTTDTEVLAALVHYSKETEFEVALRDALGKMFGTYALVALYCGKIIGVRDPLGNRPLVVGSDRTTFALASESLVFDTLGFPMHRDVMPGEMVILDASLGNWYPVGRVQGKCSVCIFEYVYFSFPASEFHGRRIQLVRKEMGRNLWRESPVEADCVVPVPDSANAAAEGYAEVSRIPYVPAIIRSHHALRTFIEPIAERRNKKASLKYSFIAEEIRGKRVALLEDSLVRGTTAKKIITKLREVGAVEVHMRVSSPPYRHPCYYGIDTYRVEGELIARRYDGDVEKVRREIGADSLRYLSIEGLKKSVNGTGTPLGYCDACFTGNYPIPIRDEDSQKSAH